MKIRIETDRLSLRRITPDDLDALHEIYADPICMQFYPGTKTRAETAEWFQRLAFDSYARHGFGLWLVCDRATGEIRGDCGITLQETPNGLEPEIGYHLLRRFWGMGIAGEAAAACRDYGVRVLGMNRIISITSPENLPSQRVAERVHQRRETFEKTSAAGGKLLRHLYITEAAPAHHQPDPEEIT